MKRTLEFVIDCGQENMDVRTFVRRYLGFSARILTALKYEGEMLKNGEPVHSNAVLKAGDTLTLTLLETGEAYEKADLPFAVLYEDEDFLVLNKPYNMPVHPSPGHDRDSVLNAAAWYFSKYAGLCVSAVVPLRPGYDRRTGAGEKQICRKRKADENVPRRVRGRNARKRVCERAHRVKAGA